MQFFTGLTVILLAASLSSCGDMTKAKSLSETAIVAFHAQYDAGAFKAMYDQSDAGLKTAGPESEFVSFMETVHKKLGQHVSSTEKGFSVNSKNFSTTTAVLREDTKFEHGSGLETFSYLVSDGSVKLQGYHIDSKDLVLK